ncbi:Mitochondrial GTPase [Kappamyces sp. JEL0829]|nr:Mitochondrial GTPase [Kappamyces sp. JEL0829]
MDFVARKVFSYGNRIFWQASGTNIRYPQHQSKAWRQLLKGTADQLTVGTHHIDLIVEVRDARIPLSCISTFEDFQRDKLVVYNKCDLANPQLQKRLETALKEFRSENVIFTKADVGSNIQKILDYAVQKCKSDPVRFPYLSIVVVGAPNVGKSTLINGLRRLGVGKGKVTQVGKRAGVTTAIQTRVKIHNDPPVYLFDTPGIFNPHVTSPINGLKIALTGATNDRLTTILNVADYLLFRLNNSAHVRTWPAVVGLDCPSDDIYQVATHIAKTQGFRMNPASRIVKLSQDPLVQESGEEWDLDKACQHMVDLYREGKFGRMTLDDLSDQALADTLKVDRAVGEEEPTKSGYSIQVHETTRPS